MPLTADMLGAALSAVGAGTRLVRPLDVLARDADAALRLAPDGVTGAGAASFLATLIQESDYFRTTVEYGSGQDYAPFVGRGFVQCTWRENYSRFGTWCHDQGLVQDPQIFVDDPESLGDYRWAWTTARWYFSVYGLWRFANAGNHYAVSQGVNRGPGSVGTDAIPRDWPARLAAYVALRQFGDDLLPDDGGEAAALRRRRGLLLN